MEVAPGNTNERGALAAVRGEAGGGGGGGAVAMLQCSTKYKQW